MSKYAFAIKDAAALLEKARYDAQRFNSRSPFTPTGGNASLHATYAAIDYTQTAWNLSEWIAHERGISAGATGSQQKAAIRAVHAAIDALCNGLYLLLGDLANGQKHWRRDAPYPPHSVQQSESPRFSTRLGTMGVTKSVPGAPYVIDANGKRIYAQIIIRDTPGD